MKGKNCNQCNKIATLQKAVAECESRFQSVVEQSPDGIAIMKGSVHEYVNQRFLEIFGYEEKKEVVGKSLEMTVHPDDLEMVSEHNMNRQLGNSSSSMYVFRGIKKNGEEIHIEISAIKITQGGSDFSLAYLRDVTERMKQEEINQHLANYDPLTDLLNRNGFFSTSGQALKSAIRNKREMTLLFIDIDGLKMINDSLGHKYGDMALKDFAIIINNCFRDSDIKARMGGDEFIVFAETSEGNNSIKERLEKSIEDFNKSFDRPFRLSVSIGSVKLDPEDPLPIDDLISMADKIMYRQKQKKGVIIRR